LGKVNPPRTSGRKSIEIHKKTRGKRPGFFY
jgi:hypothetical protein